MTERGPLGDWYANLIWVELIRCILFINQETFFSFFVPDVKKEDLMDFRYSFRDKVQTGLGAVGGPRARAARLLLKLKHVSISRTANRMEQYVT